MTESCFLEESKISNNLGFIYHPGVSMGERGHKSLFCLFVLFWNLQLSVFLSLPTRLESWAPGESSPGLGPEIPSKPRTGTQCLLNKPSLPRVGLLSLTRLCWTTKYIQKPRRKKRMQGEKQKHQKAKHPADTINKFGSLKIPLKWTNLWQVLTKKRESADRQR